MATEKKRKVSALNRAIKSEIDHCKHTKKLGKMTEVYGIPVNGPVGATGDEPPFTHCVVCKKRISKSVGAFVSPKQVSEVNNAEPIPMHRIMQKKSDSPGKKKRVPKLPARIARLSIPSKRLVYDNLKTHRDSVSEDILKRYIQLLHTDETPNKAKHKK